MNTKLVIIISIILACSNAYAQKGKSTLKLMNIKGKVMSIKDVRYEAYVVDGKVAKGEEANYEMQGSTNYRTFDSDGFMTEHTRSYSDDSIDVKIDNKYDWKKNECWTKKYYDFDTISTRLVYVHKKNQLIEMLVYNDQNKLIRKNFYTYDKKGNRVEWIIHSEWDGLERRYTYEYGKGGHIIGIKAYGENGEIKYWVKYELNKRGHMITEFSLDDEGEISRSRTFTYTYDKKKNWTSKVLYKEGKPTYIFERTIKYY
jgi:hypothetical protein